MVSKDKAKLIIQCDFDGTITVEDESFVLLDKFAIGNWRYWLDLYRENKIPVGEFNSRAFSLVRADKQSMIEFVLRSTKIRAGFDKLVDACNKKGIRMVVVSNGLDFYIEAILKSIGANIEVFAARTSFNSGEVHVNYFGPDGSMIQDGFKESFTRFFLEKQYQIAYIGNGPSDMPAARLAHYIFATDQLITLCQKAKMNHVPFDDFSVVVDSLEI